MPNVRDDSVEMTRVARRSDGRAASVTPLRPNPSRKVLVLHSVCAKLSNQHNVTGHVIRRNFMHNHVGNTATSCALAVACLVGTTNAQAPTPAAQAAPAAVSPAVA